MTACRRAFCLAVLLLSPTLSFGQTAPAWNQNLSEKAIAFGPTPMGSMLVQLKNELFALNPETGDRIWTRKDATGYSLVPNSTLVMLETPAGKIIADVEAGRDIWAFSGLGFTTVKGHVSLSKANLMLVYGQTALSLHTLVGVEYSTGRVLWTQAKLFAEGPVASKAAKIQYRNWLLDSDSSLILDPSDDGLIRIDLRSGDVMWRVPEASLPSKGKWVSLFAAGDLILVDESGRSFAVRQDTGAVAWTRAKAFPKAVEQVASTKHGLLVRGSHSVNGKGAVSWKPYLTLLSTQTGEAVWSTDEKFKGRSVFLLEGQQVTIALADGIATYDVATGELANSVAMREFEGREAPSGIERTSTGQLRVWSSQNIRLFDATGAPVYQVYLKAPGVSFLTKFAVVAMAAALNMTSASLASPGGSYTTYAPNASLFNAKFKATVDADRFTYVFTEEAGRGADRFALVRLDKATGEDTGRIRFIDRSPSFQLDPITGAVLVIDGQKLSMFRFPPAPAKGL